MDPNINNPNLDLSTPSIISVLSWGNHHAETVEKAFEELFLFQRVIQLHKEQDVRAQKALYSQLECIERWGKSVDLLRKKSNP